MSSLHVVLGAGQIGTLVAERLLSRGLRVRQVRRGGGAGVRGAELVRGDIADSSFAKSALAGAAVVYHCINVPYQRWEAEVPPQNAAILRASADAGARLVVLDNLYMYGRPDAPMNESTPMRPCSHKGELRARMAEQLLTADARDEAQVVLGRAADFYGPAVPRAYLGDRFWQRVLSGKRGETIGDPSAVHSYAYAPDVARALVTLGTHASAPRGLFLLPAAPAVSTTEMIDLFARALGRPIRTMHAPDWVLALMGLFDGDIRGFREMSYQWTLPYVVDDAKFRAAFGESATPLEIGTAETARWYAAQHVAAA